MLQKKITFWFQKRLQYYFHKFHQNGLQNYIKTALSFEQKSKFIENFSNFLGKKHTNTLKNVLE